MYTKIQPDDTVELVARPYPELSDAQFVAIVSFPGIIFSGKITDPGWIAMKERMQKLGINIRQL